MCSVVFEFESERSTSSKPAKWVMLMVRCLVVQGVLSIVKLLSHLCTGGGGRWLTIYYCNAILINSTAQSYAIIIQLSVVCTCMYQGQRGLPWQLLGRGTSSLPSPHRHLHSCQGANPSPDVGMPSLSHPLLPFCAEEQLADRKMEWLLTMT